MSELYGFQAGQQIRRQSDDQHALAEMAVQHGQDEHLQAGVALESSEMTLEAQKKMLQMMSKAGAQQNDAESGGAPPLAGTEQTDDIPDGLDALARMALSSGLPQQASDFAAKASTIRKNAIDIRTKAAAERIKDLTMATGMLDNVHDEQTWQQANALYAMTTGKPSPFAHMPFSPDTVDRIRGSLQTQKDKALTDAAKARALASGAATKEREARIPLIDAQRQLTEDRDIALRKTGAVGKMPKAEDLRAITDLISQEYGGAVTPEDARTLGRPVAERMMQLQQVNQLTRSQAASRAFLEAQAQGTFGGLRQNRKMPGTAKAPLAMPASKEKLRPNMYYQGKGKYEGQTLLWTGTGFIPADSPVLQPAADEGGQGFDNEHTTETDEGQ